MEPFRRLEAVAAPLAMRNIDTDQIIPARFLWRKRRDGWGDLLFHDLRFNDDSSPKTDFLLNQPGYRSAKMLVAGRNFGCGSSREHAVWALYDYGIRAMIAPSFGDIFANNCYQNGLLPIVLPERAVDGLLATLTGAPGTQVWADLETQEAGLNGAAYPFDIDPFRKECLLAGTDDIGFTLRLADEISAFEEGRQKTAPWINAMSRNGYEGSA
jgi:3-isopropylmalate/(R)-2-methylmalate dehydratase small subunit